MKPVNSLVIDMALAKKRIEAMHSDEMTLSGNLKDVLREALAQGRVTGGIYECGKLLELNPDGVMLCLLPEDTSSDVALHIHLTLIEAFCWENFIRVIKVDSLLNTVKQLAGGESQSEAEVGTRRPVIDGDLSCILIEHPTGKYSEAEEALLDFHTFTSEVVPYPFIPLDV